MAEYIEPGFEVEAELIEEAMYEYIQGVFPDWEPREGHLATVISEAFAEQISELIQIASNVPASIFRYYGQLVGIYAQEATFATGVTTWTVQDTAGYTIPEGTSLRLQISGEEYAIFTTVEDVAITPGSTSTAPGAVLIQAIDEGDLASNLTGPIELLDVLDYVTDVTMVGTTSGGVDAEPDEEYLDRLANRLQLLADRPILPRDFEIVAQDVPGVERAYALDLYDPGANEIQRITVASATGGSFTLTFNGQTTGAIAWNASAATVLAALRALSNVPDTDLSATGGPLNTAPVDIEFTGTLGLANQPEMTRTSSLTGTGANVSVSTPQQGRAASTNNEKMLTLFLTNELGAYVGDTVANNVKAAINAVREINFVAHTASPSYSAITVSATVVAMPNFELVDVDTAVTGAVLEYLNPATWGERDNDPGRWTNQKVVRYLEVAAVINSVIGVDYITSLTINGNPTDFTMPGVVPLPASTAGGSAALITVNAPAA